MREVLRNKELFVTAFASRPLPRPGAGFSLFKNKKVKLQELVVMSRQMATFVRSGISIVECLHAVAVQTENPTLKQALNDIRLDVLTGSTLTDAMRKHARILNEMYVSLVQAGETGGVLERTSGDRRDAVRSGGGTSGKVKAAFVYPMVVLVASVGVVFFMLVFIVPVFAKVYEQFHATTASRDTWHW